AAEHLISIFFLAESIINASPVRVGVIAALVIERMPLGAANELAGGAVHLVVTLGEGQCLYQQRTFAPTAARAVVIVVGVPVVHILAELAGKDTLSRPVLLFIVSRPAVNNVVMLFHTGGMNVGGSYRPSRIRIFLLGYLKGFQCEIERITGL